MRICSKQRICGPIIAAVLFLLAVLIITTFYNAAAAAAAAGFEHHNQKDSSLDRNQTHQSVPHRKLLGRRIQEDDDDLERQIKILNKKPIKTFQTEEGKTIDCIDIYKQPAFDHPLLKNHKIKLRPSHHASSSPYGSSSSSFVCPEGTVPIKRTSKEDLRRARSFAELYPETVVAATSADHQNVARTTGQHLAVVSTPIGGKTYFGVSGDLNAQHPMTSLDQSSSSQLWIESSPSETFNTLQAGWMVSPLLFGDNGTHVFGYWEGSGSSGCFNTLCVGFVQVSTEAYIGGVLQNTSFYGDDRKLLLPLRLYKDGKTGDWWLTETKQDLMDIHIGYWPKELLPSLSVGTTTVSWGGAVKANRAAQSPQMGNGHFPAGVGQWNYGCYIGNMQVLNNEQIWEEPIGSMETFVDNEQCYKLEYYGFVDRYFGYAFQFGGPGGICGV